ncbi:MAG: hypothetical protein OSA06_02255 [Acidimicrobiales bacterium]|nr:hypothetical protein [Acidimicrobiales bacterium]
MRKLAVVLIWVLMVSGCGSEQVETFAAPTTTSQASEPSLASNTTQDSVPPLPTVTAAPTTASTTGPPATTTEGAPFTFAECVAKLPLTIRTGQVLLVLVDQPGLTEMAALAREGLLGGVVLLGDPDAGLTEALGGLQSQALVGPLVIAVDEEGGVVQRLENLLGFMVSAQQQATGTPEEARALAQQRAEALAALGFTMNLAPVIDVGGGPGIGSRAFSDDPAVVAEYGLAVASGIAAGGLVPVFKHFPGHGNADADSHRSLPVTPPLAEMRVNDLLPWSDIPYEIFGPTGAAVMVAHLDVPGLTYGQPASLSVEAITGLLRGEIGFDGVVVADYLGMAAVTSLTDQPTAAVWSLIAGADLLIVGDDQSAAASVVMVRSVALAIETALDEGSLSVTRLNEAVGRVFVLRQSDPCQVLLNL